jgi:ParB family chromosome partitioning protein
VDLCLEKLEPAGAPAKGKKGKKESPTWTAEQLEKAGAVVKVDENFGGVTIVRGVVKPATAKKVPTISGADGDPVEKVPTISGALAARLAIQATKAMQQALAEEPRLGLVALLAAFLTGKHYGYCGTDELPIRVKHEGFEWQKNKGDERFEDAFARVTAMSVDELFNLTSRIAAAALDLQLGYSTWLPFVKAVNPLAEAMNAGILNAALRQHFDAEDYFGGASKPFVIQAIREAVNEDEARKAEKMKKAELVEYALKNVVPTGWLPLELRSPNYDGPQSAPDPDTDVPAFLRKGNSDGEGRDDG